MKLAILPNWCKWLSLAIIIAAFGIDYKAFLAGLLGQPEPIYTSSDFLHSFPFSDLLLMLGIIVYILSKDKWDDEYINIIRARALLTALLIISVVVMFVYGFNGKIDLSYLLLIQLLSYIIIFKFLKVRTEVINNP